MSSIAAPNFAASAVRYVLAELGVVHAEGERFKEVTLEGGISFFIKLHDDEKSLELSAPLADEGEPLSAALLTQMLEANFTTDGPVLALRRGQPFLLCQLHADRLSYPEFRDRWEQFINLVEAWSALCAETEVKT